MTQFSSTRQAKTPRASAPHLTTQGGGGGARWGQKVQKECSQHMTCQAEIYGSARVSTQRWKRLREERARAKGGTPTDVRLYPLISHQQTIHIQKRVRYVQWFFLRWSRRKLRASDSSPQFLTTATEVLTTFSSPSLFSLTRPHRRPRSSREGTCNKDPTSHQKGVLMSSTQQKKKGGHMGVTAPHTSSPLQFHSTPAKAPPELARARDQTLCKRILFWVQSASTRATMPDSSQSSANKHK